MTNLVLTRHLGEKITLTLPSGETVNVRVAHIQNDTVYLEVEGGNLELIRDDKLYLKIGDNLKNRTLYTQQLFPFMNEDPNR